MAGKSPADKATGALGFGAAAMLVCCGSHLLVVGVLGGLAVGTVLGVAAGVLALVALVAALLLVRRRRRAPCAVPRNPTPASASRGFGEPRPKETSHVR